MTVQDEDLQLQPAPWKKWLVFLPAGLLLLGWLIETPPGILGKADAVAYAVCHRIGSHSFYMGGVQLPLCARCTGMYLGAVLGLLYQSIVSPHRSGAPRRSVIAVLVLLFGAFGLDGVNSYLSLFRGAPSLYEPQNWMRLLTGTGMGLVIAVALFPAFNQTVWSQWDRRPAIGGLGSFGILAGLGLLVDGAVLTGNPIILYPLALVSAAGVLVLLTTVYSMVVLMIFRYENRFQRLNQMLLPLMGGFTFGLLQIVILDAVRFLLTGTWDGFHLG